MKTLNDKALAILLEGLTHYVNIGKDIDASIYYAADKTAHMRLPGASTVMHGEWLLMQDGYFIKWQNGPEGKWQITHELGQFIYIDPTGKDAGRITQINPGDAASLA